MDQAVVHALYMSFEILDTPPNFSTMAKTEIIYPRNMGALAAINFTKDKYSAPRAIEKNENHGSRFGATS